MDPITIIAAASAAIKVGEELYAFISGLRKTAQQTGEWTDAQEQAFLALEQQRANSPRWQTTDAQRASA